MKYKSGDILYYCNPFVFTIEVVEIAYLYTDELGEWCIDQTGAYLAEHDLFLNLDEAREQALERLNAFYHKKQYEIQHQDPQIQKDDLWN